MLRSPFHDRSGIIGAQEFADIKKSIGNFKVRTISDLESIAYRGMGRDYITKADAPAISTTTGFWQAILGARGWSQLNQEANTVAFIPKKPWLKSGDRLVTTRAAASGGGEAENATLPDTIKPTLDTISTKPKSIVHTFNSSEILSFLGEIDDAIGDPMRWLREELAKHHVEMQNIMLNTDNDTLAGNNLESLNRVIASNAEIGVIGQTAGDLDIFGKDRDAGASIYDAQTSQAASDRSLGLDIINDLFQNVWVAGGDPTIIHTGYDTIQALQELLQTQQRWEGVGRVVPTFNGVQGIAGHEGGMMVSTYFGKPIIPSKNVFQDTISEILLMDTRYLYMRTAKPTQYFETGISHGQPFAVDNLGDEGMFRTMWELWNVGYPFQGKARSLQ